MLSLPSGSPGSAAQLSDSSHTCVALGMTREPSWAQEEGTKAKEDTERKE